MQLRGVPRGINIGNQGENSHDASNLALTDAPHYAPRTCRSPCPFLSRQVAPVLTVVKLPFIPRTHTHRTDNRMAGKPASGRCLQSSRPAAMATAGGRHNGVNSTNLFTNAVHTSRSHLDTVNDPEISLASRRLRVLAKGLDQEHFLR